jgi:hypothetical protein
MAVKFALRDHLHEFNCVENELLHNAQVVVVHAVLPGIFNEARVHFIQLHLVQQCPCE